MLRPAVVLAVLAVAAPANALAAGAHKTHRTNSKGLALGGKVASIDGKSKVAVLSLRATKGKFVALDLRGASVRFASRHGKTRSGRLSEVRTRDRVVVKLRVSNRVARADARAGISAPVSEVFDEQPASGGSTGPAEDATVCGVVQVVSGTQVVIAVGDGADARTITLDLAQADVYAGHPPVASSAASIVTGDRVLANLAVSEQTLRADLRAGTPVGVTKLFDLGTPQQSSGGGDQEPAALGGTVTGIVGSQVTISFGDGDSKHTAILDIGSAQLFSGFKADGPTPIDASGVQLGDRVYALLSVSRDVARGDVQSGTPVPVAKLYDGGTSKPEPPHQPESAALGGHIVSLGSGQVTISFGDGADAHTAVLDISAAQLFSGFNLSSATPIDAGALTVGDRIYAVLSVSSDTAESDVHSGTPVPVTKLYDGGPSPTTPPAPPSAPKPGTLGGHIVGLGSGQVTISFGDGTDAHTAVLDISAAQLFSGFNLSSATPIDAGALTVGDRVYAVLSVPSDTASADVQAGTPVPVAKLYDGGPAH